MYLKILTLQLIRFLKELGFLYVFFLVLLISAFFGVLSNVLIKIQTFYDNKTLISFLVSIIYLLFNQSFRRFNYSSFIFGQSSIFKIIISEKTILLFPFIVLYLLVIGLSYNILIIFGAYFFSILEPFILTKNNANFKTKKVKLFAKIENNNEIRNRSKSIFLLFLVTIFVISAIKSNIKLSFFLFTFITILFSLFQLLTEPKYYLINNSYTPNSFFLKGLLNSLKDYLKISFPLLIVLVVFYFENYQKIFIGYLIFTIVYSLFSLGIILIKYSFYPNKFVISFMAVFFSALVLYGVVLPNIGLLVILGLVYFYFQAKSNLKNYL